VTLYAQPRRRCARYRERGQPPWQAGDVRRAAPAPLLWPRHRARSPVAITRAAASLIYLFCLPRLGVRFARRLARCARAPKRRRIGCTGSRHYLRRIAGLRYPPFGGRQAPGVNDIETCSATGAACARGACAADCYAGLRQARVTLSGGSSARRRPLALLPLLPPAWPVSLWTAPGGGVAAYYTALRCLAHWANNEKAGAMPPFPATAAPRYL